MIRVVFEMEGPTLQECEKWGELIIDACRLDPELHHIELTEVTETTTEESNS